MRGVGGVELSSAIFVSALSKADTQQEARLLDKTKACNESYEEQLPDFDSWALTAGILLSKVLFFSNKRTRL